MTFRISPLWWPVLAAASPVLIVLLAVRNRTYRANVKIEQEENCRRMASARPLALPAHDSLKLTVLVEERAQPGFRTAPGVSYLLETDQGSLLFDLGFGDEDGVLTHNLAKARPDLSKVKGLVISHLHPDHMGGVTALKQGRVSLPQGCEGLEGLPCYLPAAAGADSLDVRQVDGPALLPAGIGTTGPLARSLFFMGLTLEQTLLVRLRDKGVVVITGCGHPTISRILDYVERLVTEPVYAVVGGLHLPVTDSPLTLPGIKVQMIVSTGKPPWRRITDEDVDEVVAVLNRKAVKRLYLSTHDICGHAAGRLEGEIRGKTVCLDAGQTYTL